MRHFFLASMAIATLTLIWAADWPMPGGGPQHNGWARSERLIDKRNVSTLKLLYTVRAGAQSGHQSSLTAPIINGNLITFRGFKEMLIFGERSNRVFSMDADLNQILWESQMTDDGENALSATSTSACPGGLSAPVIMAGSSSALLHFAAEASQMPAATGVKPQRLSPYFPPLSQTLYPLRATTLTQLSALYAISSDGKLHVLNSSTGGDLLPAINFLPANAKVTSLNIWENILYATTGSNCDGYRNALFAIDLLAHEKKVTSFVPPAGGFSGLGGTSIGKDGTVFAQVTCAPGDTIGHCHETVVALTPKDLKVKDYFTVDVTRAGEKSLEAAGITPLVFSSMAKEMLLAGGRDGRLYLLDSKSLGGADHHTPLFASERITQASRKAYGYGFRGTFSSWIDFSTGATWFYAPIFGPPDRSAKLVPPKSAPLDGSILALKLVEESGHPALQTVWLSHDILSPAPAVIANRMVFTLSTGELPPLSRRNRNRHNAELAQTTGKTTLLVFDGATGKQLYSSGDAIASSARGGGLAVANGRVYFSTQDNTVYCFGLPKSQSQLEAQ